MLEIARRKPWIPALILIGLLGGACGRKASRFPEAVLEVRGMT